MKKLSQLVDAALQQAQAKVASAADAPAPVMPTVKVAESHDSKSCHDSHCKDCHKEKKASTTKVAEAYRLAESLDYLGQLMPKIAESGQPQVLVSPDKGATKDTPTKATSLSAQMASSGGGEMHGSNLETNAPKHAYEEEDPFTHTPKGNPKTLETDPAVPAGVAPDNARAASMTKRDALTSFVRSGTAPYLREPAFSAASDKGLSDNLQHTEGAKIAKEEESKAKRLGKAALVGGAGAVGAAGGALHGGMTGLLANTDRLRAAAVTREGTPVVSKALSNMASKSIKRYAAGGALLGGGITGAAAHKAMKDKEKKSSLDEVRDKLASKAGLATRLGDKALDVFTGSAKLQKYPMAGKAVDTLADIGGHLGGKTHASRVGRGLMAAGGTAVGVGAAGAGLAAGKGDK